MNIQAELKKNGIEVTCQLDEIIVNSILKSISRRIFESFPDLEFNEHTIFKKLSCLKMYKAKMKNNIAEASYYYKFQSIYFDENIEIEDLEEFAIHECIHFLQEVKTNKNKLKKMGLCKYFGSKPIGLGLNEAGTQYTASVIIGIEPDFEKYYDISLFTPSPSYYPLECSLLNEILYFTGNNLLFKSILLSTDDFKNKIVELTSENTYKKLQTQFDKILDLEEDISKINSKILDLEDGSSKFESFNNRLINQKHKIAKSFIETQNLIIKEFFDGDFNKITNLEELEQFRKKLYKFSDIIGFVKDYSFFDNYYIEMMNKLEHKYNVLENGGCETALLKSPKFSILAFFHKLINTLDFSKRKTDKNL